MGNSKIDCWRTFLKASMLILGVYACQEQVYFDIRVSDVNIVDIFTGDIIPHQDVLIKENRIVNIRDHDGASSLYKHDIKASGKYLIPGLWDMHAHAVTDIDYWHALPLNIANGITGIREMFGDLKLTKSLRKKGTVNDLPIPRLKVAGHILGGDPPRTGAPVGTVQEGIEYVNILYEQGADFIKTYSYLKPEVYRAILKRAEVVGLPVYGHPPLLLGLEEAAQLGQRSFEHLSEIPVWCTNYSDFLIEDMANNWYGTGIPLSQRRFKDTIYHGFDEEVLSQLAKTLIDHDAYVCPTLTVYEFLTHDPHRSDAGFDFDKFLNPFRAWLRTEDINWSKMNYSRDSIYPTLSLRRRKNVLSQLIENGVKIIAGTDAGITMHGFDLHNELELYVAAGMTPLQALQSATIVPAQLLDMDDSLGSIEAGKLADLVILDQNPMEQISNTTGITGVIADGVFVSQQSIDNVLHRIQHTYSSNIMDTLGIVLRTRGISDVISIVDSLIKLNSTDLLKGLQLTVLAYQLMREDRMQEAVLLLKKEIEINPDQATFPLESLGDSYRYLGQPDSALIYYEKLYNYGGPTQLSAVSKIKRTKNPAYGRPRYHTVPIERLKKFVGLYQAPNKTEKQISLQGNQMFLTDRHSKYTLKCLNDSTFHLEENYPEQAIFRESNDGSIKLLLVSNRTVNIFPKVDQN